MTNIENLNSQYVDAKKLLDILNLYSEKILQEQNYKEAAPVEKSEQSIKLLMELSQEIKCNEFVLLADTIDICRQYLVCRDTIISYKNALLKAENASQASIDSATNDVKAAQNRLDELNRLFEQKHTSKIDSTEALNNIISKSIADTISDVTRTTEQLKNEARTLLEKENNVELSIDDPITIQDTLPSTLLAARYPFKESIS